MKTTTTKSEKAKLEEAFALWENTKGNTVYYTGKTSDEKPVRVVAFVNAIKKNPNQPDLNVYEQVEKGKKKPEIAQLWENKSKAGKAYFNGKDNEGKKLVGFYNDKTENGKYPAIRVYYSE